MSINLYRTAREKNAWSNSHATATVYSKPELNEMCPDKYRQIKINDQRMAWHNGLAHSTRVQTGLRAVTATAMR